ELATNTVYIWTPKGDSPKDNIIRGSVFDNGIEIENKENVIVEYMEFLQNKKTGINLLTSSNITIDGNKIMFPDSKGISVSGTDNVIKNNLVSGANHLGIELFGSNSVISDNKIENTFLHKYIGISGGGQWYMG